MIETLSEEQRSLVLKAGELFMRLGIRSVSMDDLARELGVSKKTIYQIVENKTELVNMVLQCDTEEDMAVLENHRNDSRDAIDEMLRNSRYFIRGMREMSPTTIYDLQKYYPELFRNNFQAHIDHMRGRVRQNIERGMEEGLYRADIDADIIAHLFVSTVQVVIDRDTFPAHERPFSEVILEHSKYHFNGIVNQFGRERLEHYLQQEDLA